MTRYALLGVVGIFLGCKDSGGNSDPPPIVHPDESTHPLAMVEPAVVTVTTETVYPGRFYTYTITGEFHNLSMEVMSRPYVNIEIQTDWDCRFDVAWIENPRGCSKQEELSPGESLKFNHTVRQFQHDSDQCFKLDVNFSFNARWKSDGSKVYSTYGTIDAMPNPAVVTDYPKLIFQVADDYNECSW